MSHRETPMRQAVRKFHEAGLRTTSDVKEAERICREIEPNLVWAFFMRGVFDAMAKWPAEARAAPTEADRERMRKAAERTRRDKETCRELDISPLELATRRLSSVLGPVMENAAKAAKYDRVVELLDHWIVGNMRLGDCTKERLVAEAAKLAHAATEARSHATLYSTIASHMRDGEILRDSAKRTTILELLLAVKNSQ